LFRDFGMSETANRGKMARETGGGQAHVGITIDVLLSNDIAYPIKLF
jgi:hypothetical protein